MTLAVMRVTHAGVLLDFGRQVLLTDPWFSERRGYYRGEPIRGRLLLICDGTPERFATALQPAAPATQVKILEPWEPLTVNGAATRLPKAVTR